MTHVDYHNGSYWIPREAYQSLENRVEELLFQLNLACEGLESVQSLIPGDSLNALAKTIREKTGA